MIQTKIKSEALRKALDEMTRVVYRGDVHKACRYTAFAIGRGVKNATPTAGKKRPLVTISRAKGVYRMISWRGGTRKEIPISGAQDPRRIIAYRGAARNAWISAIGDIGKSGKLVGGAKAGLARRTGKGTDNKDKLKPVITLENTVSYIDILDRQHGIMREGMRRGLKTIELRLTKLAQKMATG